MGAINDFNRFVEPDNLTQDFLIPGSIAFGNGDLCYAAGADVVKPADQQAAAVSVVLGRQTFANNFIGVSQAQVLASETSTTKRITIRTDAVVEINCPSQTWAKGDLCCIFVNGGTFLCDPQQVDKCTKINQAIGVCVKAVLSAATRVRVRLMSKIADNYFDCFKALGVGGQQGQGVTTQGDANFILTIDSTVFQNQVPTAARQGTLPTEANSVGLEFYFTNNSAGAFSVTFVGGAAVKGNAVVPQNKTGHFWCDGTNWNGLVSA
jgi:hypothetical protein